MNWHSLWTNGFCKLDARVLEVPTTVCGVLLYTDEGHSPYFTPEKLVQFAIGYLSLSNEFRNHLVTARAREVRAEGISGGVIGTLLAEQHKPFSSKSITIDDPTDLRGLI